ncbi:hypothetical protein tb265_10710 [Gemmatimonadetes bacterium T265]|nr:hypothetical protein tb265_10710 [Gemmatimonadetes bacterium T265]
MPRSAARPLTLVALAAGAALAAAGGCDRPRRADTPQAAPPAQPSVAPVAPTPKPAPPPKPLADLRIEIDTHARRLTVFRADSERETYPVAVGSPRWPTRHGSWKVVQVIWNPEWRPPEESWAAGLERRGPGDPENPLGRVQLVYDPPRTIHGTNHPASIGKAVSHGSIRMGDGDITRLAREVMRVAGVERDSAWYARVREDRHEKAIIDLPKVVPIRVY